MPSTFGASVYRSQQPAPANQGERPGTVAPKRLEPACQRLAQLLHGSKNPVADRILEVVPKLLHRVQLRTVGRQRNDSHVLGQPRVVFGKVKAGPVLDDDMDGRRIMGRDLFEKLAGRLLMDGALKAKHAPGPRHLHGSVGVVPLVLLLMGNDHPHATQPPHPAMLGMQPEAWLPAPSGAALRAKAPPFGYLAPLD